MDGPAFDRESFGKRIDQKHDEGSVIQRNWQRNNNAIAMDCYVYVAGITSGLLPPKKSEGLRKQRLMTRDESRWQVRDTVEGRQLPAHC